MLVRINAVRIYGIYDFCEKIGVSPWKWWADVKPEKADELYINLPKEGYTEDEAECSISRDFPK